MNSCRTSGIPKFWRLLSHLSSGTDPVIPMIHSTVTATNDSESQADERATTIVFVLKYAYPGYSGSNLRTICGSSLHEPQAEA
eukprot:924890-Rhodomonas_salina.1